MTSPSQERLNQLEADLRRAADGRTPEWLRAQLAAGAYVYGAGSFGRRVVRQLAALGLPCHGIVDRKAGTGEPEIDGVPLIHPDALTPGLCAGRVLIVGVFNPFNDLGEIVRAMHPCGFAQIMWGADLPDALGAAFEDFWLSGRRFLLDNIAPLRAAYALLGDDVSRRTFESVIRFRALDGDRPDPEPDYATQYLPPDLPGFDQPITFVDGGAYDGDTFRSLQSQGMEIGNWLAFEPDPQNFMKLAAFAQNCGTRASLLPCGLAATASQLRFAAGNKTDSRIVGVAEAGIMIQCLAIDEAFCNTPVDYVKLDIEGAEAAALEGMRNTIAKYRLRLAISAYHRPQDVWAIPLQLHALLPGAPIFLRQHQQNTFELVAYAVPAGR